jgi:hypothetical protein
MSHYPYLHRGQTVVYCWDNIISSLPNINLASRIPTQYGSEKYQSLADILYDPNLGSELASNSTTRLVRLNYNINFPFSHPYTFSGWTYDSVFDVYRNNSNPSNNFRRLSFTQSTASIFLYFHIQNNDFLNIVQNQRPNRRNVDFYYLITASFTFSMSVNITDWAGYFPLSMRQPSFNIIGSFGAEYAEPINLFLGVPKLKYPETDLITTCPLPTVRCCNSTSFKELNRLLDSSQLVMYTDDLSYEDSLFFSTPTNPDYLPIEIYDYVTGIYNSIKNDLTINTYWRAGSFPGFIPQGLPNSSNLANYWFLEKNVIN